MSEPKLDEEENLSWLVPPPDPLDSAAWDRYWIEQVRHDLGPPLFDMFCNDRKLVQLMNAERMKSVLCAGNGISQEPKALAQAGFQVAALDLSAQAVEMAREFELPTEAFQHFCDPGMRRQGGHVDFLVGDLLDPAACPGPFDVVIERRTAQSFCNHGMGAVLEALAYRVGEGGIFFSHCHDGGWKPPTEPRHITKSWFGQNGWTIWCGGPGRKPPGRVAWLFTSTG